MNRSILKHSWYVMENELNERWPALTWSDVEYIFADYDRFAAVVQRRRHVSEIVARADVDDFLEHLNLRTSIA